MKYRLLKFYPGASVGEVFTADEWHDRLEVYVENFPDWFGRVDEDPQFKVKIEDDYLEVGNIFDTTMRVQFNADPSDAELIRDAIAAVIRYIYTEPGNSRLTDINTRLQQAAKIARTKVQGIE